MDDNIFEVAPSVEGQGEIEENAVEKDVEESTPEDNGQVENIEEQPLILGKFKSEDDLRKAHNNLCRKIEAEMGLPYGTIKPTSEDLAEDYQNMQAYYTRMSQNRRPNVAPKVEQPHDDEERFMEWFYSEVQTDPVNAYRELAKREASKIITEYRAQVEPIVRERQSQELIKLTAAKYKDFGNYTDAITEEINRIGIEEPYLLSSPLLYETAYLRAKSRTLEENARLALKTARKQHLKSVTPKRKSITK